MASVLSLMSRSNTTSVCKSKTMPLEGEDTAQLLLFFNDLFDSVNGGIAVCGKKGTVLRSVIDTTSEQCEQEKMWKDAVPVFRSMTFTKRKPGDRERPEVLNNWILTLQGFILLKSVLKDLGVEKFSTRAFNQDPLENFFGQMRQHGGRNTRPSCSAFQGYYKTLLVNSISQTPSKGFNCEIDESSDFLVDLRTFLSAEASQSQGFVDWELPSLPDDFDANEILVHSAVTNLNSFVMKTISPQFSQCETCSKNIVQSKSTVLGEEYSCTPNFIAFMTTITNICYYYIPRISHKLQFLEKITQYIIQAIAFDFVACEHAQSLKEYAVKESIDHLCIQYFTYITKIMRRSEKLPNKCDPLMKDASVVYHKSLKKR